MTPKLVAANSLNQITSNENRSGIPEVPLTR